MCHLPRKIEEPLSRFVDKRLPFLFYSNLTVSSFIWRKWIKSPSHAVVSSAIEMPIVYNFGKDHEHFCRKKNTIITSAYWHSFTLMQEWGQIRQNRRSWFELTQYLWDRRISASAGKIVFFASKFHNFTHLDFDEPIICELCGALGLLSHNKSFAATRRIRGYRGWIVACPHLTQCEKL